MDRSDSLMLVTDLLLLVLHAVAEGAGRVNNRVPGSGLVLRDHVFPSLGTRTCPDTHGSYRYLNWEVGKHQSNVVGFCVWMS